MFSKLGCTKNRGSLFFRYLSLHMKIFPLSGEKVNLNFSKNCDFCFGKWKLFVRDSPL